MNLKDRVFVFCVQHGLVLYKKDCTDALAIDGSLEAIGKENCLLHREGLDYDILRVHIVIQADGKVRTVPIGLYQAHGEALVKSAMEAYPSAIAESYSRALALQETVLDTAAPVHVGVLLHKGDGLTSSGVGQDIHLKSFALAATSVKIGLADAS